MLREGRIVRLAEASILDAPALRALAAEIDGRMSEQVQEAKRERVPQAIIDGMQDLAANDATTLRRIASLVDAVRSGACVAELDQRVDSDGPPPGSVVAETLGKWGVGLLLDDEN
jgi:hypothetical protein